MRLIPTPATKAVPADCACPVCSGHSVPLGAVDFNKSCSHIEQQEFQPSGEAVHYFRCEACTHVFSPGFWAWSSADFAQRIYNGEHVTVDPDFVESRPTANAELLDRLFTDVGAIRHLDYGGGNGTLSKRLRNFGWDSTSYDPFSTSDGELSDLGEFNLITAFEVFEHAAHPDDLMTDLVTALSADSALILFSTLLSDGHLAPGEKLDWWYCAPRNGHISLFSRKSLKTLGNRYDFEVYSINDGLHAFANEIPPWAAHLFASR